MPDQRKIAFEVIWRVENIKSWLQARVDTLYSPQFLAETLMNTRWKLRLSRKLYLAEKYISLALERDVEDDHPEAIALIYELSFLACDGSALKSKSCMTKFAPQTVSLELNVKEVEILEKSKEAFLPGGVLTVCCKLWKALSTSKGVQCSIRSVIGRKCITLDGKIYYFSNLRNHSKVTANFMPPFSEINFISFDVQLVPPNYFMRFEKGEIKCKCLNFHSYKLYVLDAGGQKMNWFDSSEVASLFTSHKSYEYQTHFSYSSVESMLKNDSLSLQLEITYSPEVQSQCIEYADNSCKKLTDESVDLEKVEAFISEKVHSCSLDCLHLSEYKEKACNIEKNESGDEKECFDAARKTHLPSTNFIEDLTSVYNDRLFCDTKLKTDSETFPAHRSVLSARSPEFKKIFMTEMKEKAGECINVPNIGSDTVRRMLQFIYTDCTEDLEMQSAKDLYIASKKYDIVSLKQRCLSFMKSNLSVSNVCEVLVFADMHHDKDLESAAQEFVLRYDKEVFCSDEWKYFMKKCGNLAAQVMYLKCIKN